MHIVSVASRLYSHSSDEQQEKKTKIGQLTL